MKKFLCSFNWFTEMFRTLISCVLSKNSIKINANERLANSHNNSLFVIY